METQLLYSQKLCIPLCLNIKKLKEKCTEKGISFDKEPEQRTYIFYAKSESDLIWLKEHNNLKIF